MEGSCGEWWSIVVNGGGVAVGRVASSGCVNGSCGGADGGLEYIVGIMGALLYIYAYLVWGWSV